jgi:hypothetical protein
MKLLLIMMISCTFVLGMGMIGLTFLFGKMLLTYTVRDNHF